MNYDPLKHHRRSIRLKGYDYSRAGAYFVTICVHNRACLLGQITNDHVQLNDAGAMIGRWWQELSNKFPTFEPDAFIVMPNHIHCIVVITNDDDVGAGPPDKGQPHRVAPTDAPTETPTDRPSLGDMMDWFKTMTTDEYIRGVKQFGWERFDKKVFQRNYYEHIIRNERELNAIREYIENNPANWASDMDNLKNIRRSPLPEIINDYLQDMGIL